MDSKRYRETKCLCKRLEARQAASYSCVNHRQTTVVDTRRNFKIRPFKRPMKAKKYHKCVNYNFIYLAEIFQPRCNLDMQFSELYS